jgi:HSP20 family protein
MPNLKIWSEQELARMREDVDQLFDNLRRDLGLPGRGCAMIGRARLYEEKDAYLIQMEVPGCPPEELDVNLREQELLVVFQRRDRIDHARRTTSCSQRLKLPGPVKVEGAEARCSEGVLSIRAPKLRRPLGRRVPVISE